jgi:hypothetical protein
MRLNPSSYKECIDDGSCASNVAGGEDSQLGEIAKMPLSVSKASRCIKEVHLIGTKDTYGNGLSRSNDILYNP